MNDNLPDFEDMVNLASEIREAKYELLRMKNELEYVLAEITRESTKNEKYWVNNRPPSVSFIQSNYHILGLTDKQSEYLKEIKAKISYLEGELEEKRRLFIIYRDMVDVWRTKSANKRASL